jgi:Protein of unknown function (DUF2905)
MDSSALGKWILLLGLGIMALGLILYLAGRSGLPLGALPGDVRIERRGFSLYFPIVTTVILSILLTVLINFVVRLFRK